MKLEKISNKKFFLLLTLINGIILLLIIFFFYFICKNQNKIINQNKYEIEIPKEIKDYIDKENNVIKDAKTIGGNFIYIQAVSKNCGSCHQKYIYVFDNNNNKVFETTSDDNFFGFSTDDSFSIIEPIRKENEPLCCPTTYKTRIFKWNGNTFEE